MRDGGTEGRSAKRARKGRAGHLQQRCAATQASLCIAIHPQTAFESDDIVNITQLDANRKTRKDVPCHFAGGEAPAHPSLVICALIRDPQVHQPPHRPPALAAAHYDFLHSCSAYRTSAHISSHQDALLESAISPTSNPPTALHDRVMHRTAMAAQRPKTPQVFPGRRNTREKSHRCARTHET
jgi:hypothetical protein